MSTEFWVQIVVYAISLGSFGGVVMTKLKYIEEKLDKHNHFGDRLTRCEADLKSAHYRIGELKGVEK